MSTTRRIIFNSAESSVRAVTVFQRRAEVHREFRFPLKAGQTEVCIERLPACLDDTSIRVDGLGRATILDVVYNPPEAIHSQGKSSALRSLEVQRAALVREERLLRSQSKIMEDYTKTFNARDVGTKQIFEFLGDYRSEGAQLFEKLDVVQERLLQIDTEIGTERRRAATPSKSSTVKIAILVSAEEDGPAELLLSYVVSNASWMPLYDFRAFIDPNSKGSSSVRIHYRAAVNQTTGEDWNDATLTLSTNSPLAGTSVPELYPWHIGANDARVVTWRGSFKPNTSTSPAPQIRSEPNSRKGSPKVSTSGEDWPLPMMKTSAAATKDGAVWASYQIQGPVSIPSDSLTRKIMVATIDLDCELEWITVPKESPSAFLQCQVRNTSPFVLLQGPVNIFLDNGFVSKSFIPLVVPHEQFSCSLGMDPSIRVIYHPLSKKSRTGGYLLSSKSESVLYTQRITIKNTRRMVVPKFVVREQVPISEDAKFRVTLIEPKELAAAKLGVPVEVALGIQAEWTRREVLNAELTRSSSLSSLGMENADGHLEWTCRIAEGQTRDLVLAWEITSPPGEKWYRQ